MTDGVKQWPVALRLADRMGRGRGRMRFIDRLQSVPRPRKPDLTHWDQQELAAVWIGHATVLLRMGGMTILTDPVFSNRIGIGFGLFTGGPQRHLAPALSLQELPPIDLVLVSHAHFDHLDRPTLSRLPKRVPVITAHDTADLIRDLGFQHITEMRWGESLQLASIKVTSQKVRHWGARTFIDQHRGFSGFVIESGKRRVLYGADTAYCDYFREAGKVDLAILGIAAYDPYIQAHATPEQAWEMADHVRADYILPMHHSTFRLSHEPMNEPIERMLEVAGSGRDRIVVREVGGQWSL
ncbi:MAG: MBL fold metallo-hydrolase [Bacillota bacterium]